MIKEKMSFAKVHIEKKGDLPFISLPKEVGLTEGSFFLKQADGVIYLIPAKHPWKNFWESLTRFSDDFLVERNQSMDLKREEESLIN